MVSWFTQLTNKQKISSLIPGETQILLGFLSGKAPGVKMSAKSRSCGVNHCGLSVSTWLKTINKELTLVEKKPENQCALCMTELLGLKPK